MPRQATANREDFAKYTKNGTIKIIIGSSAFPQNADQPPQKAHVFHIYRDLLTSTSPYFRDKLNTADNDPQARPQPQPHPHRAHVANDNGPLFVPQDTPEVTEPDVLREPTLDLIPFTWFINWIYNKSLNPLVRDPVVTVDTYLMAHELGSERFRNDIVDALRSHHARRPDDQLGLRALLKLADRMPPENKANEGKNKLLEFLVAQMTYKVITRGWEAGGFAGNGLVKQLFGRHREVVMWHCDALWEMLGESGVSEAMGCLGRDERVVKMEANGHLDEDEDRKMNVKRPALCLPCNPAEKEGCAFHEHKSRESRCGNAMLID
ncbi:uncharacterized protein AB675_8132 [Cyphellophora attinorum]|uniref:BTB domain-containing protein n=1 Tax=Cyphellophora attinorum TaxID=1664694 RepID=A0A0N1HAS4_9EURO|nr:uncharacterized protein AB675_8132 [Phialophora attinorum]KPI41176.1 hypothetical protein AB675_8132 [Phialophora attinorum]